MTTGKDVKKKKGNKHDERMHKKVMQNCGMIAEVIAYRTTNDIDVKFDDGAIRYNIAYSNFQKGLVGHPDKLQKKEVESKH